MAHVQAHQRTRGCQRHSDNTKQQRSFRVIQGKEKVAVCTVTVLELYFYIVF